MRLTEYQRTALTAMQRDPDCKYHTAESLNSTIATLDGLYRKGLVSWAFGTTRSDGAHRGRWWKLTEQGKEVQP